MTIALGIPHCPWKPERVQSLARLFEQLGIGGEDTSAPPHHCRVFGELGPTRALVWAQKLWAWGAEVDADYFLTLQDDVEVAPNFWAALEAMLRVLPDEVIGLHTSHPLAPELCRDDVRWVTTSDGLQGVGYVMPRKLLVEFREWLASHVKDLEGYPEGEDTLIGLWCLATGRRIYHPVPTIIDHDTSIASAYGNDRHGNRRPTVVWKNAKAFDHAWTLATLAEERFWRGLGKVIQGPEGLQWANNIAPDPVKHAGRFYAVSPELARKWVEGFSDEDYRRAMRDDGRTLTRKLYHQRMARNVENAPDVRILICTPSHGAPHPMYNATVFRAAADPELNVDNQWEMLGALQMNKDIVRLRSRFARIGLETDATHFWLLDDDNSCSLDLLKGMLAADRDVVLAPYASREGVDWAGAFKAAVSGVAPEAGAYRFKIRRIDPSKPIDPDAQACAEIRGAGLGCALIKREAFEEMIRYYRAQDGLRVDLEEVSDFIEGRTPSLPGPLGGRMLIERLVDELKRWRKGHMGLVFEDSFQGQKAETVALFQLLAREGMLLSEDLAFCERWRDMGGKVWLYVGPGAPAAHHGDFTFQGRIEAFGLKRSAA